jgi:hypothetical protein
MGGVPRPGFGFLGADEKMPMDLGADSPALERKELLETLMAQQAKGQRDVLSQDLLNEIGKKGPGEKEKIDLLASVLDKQQMENIHRAVETLKTNPEVIDDAKAEALHFMRETVPYLFSVLAIRFDLKEVGTVQSFVNLLPKVSDPEENELLEGVSFLNSHKDLETSRYFSTSLEPEILADTKVLSQAARDAIDATKDKGVMTWMGEKMKEHPIATGAFLLLGTFGLYEAGKGLYHMAKGDKPDEKAVQSDSGPGLIGRLTEGWSFLTKTAISTAVFGGGLLIAGNILGNEQVEKYLKEHHLSFLYDYRLTAALIRFCQGDFEEGLATWNFGVRDPEARRRHEVYASQFGVTDKAVWLMAGLKYKDLLDADPKREFPLATGVFASIPVLRDYFKMPDQVSSENQVLALMKVHAAEIQEKISGANDMTLDEVLKKAFELDIFKASDSAAADTYSPELEGFVKGHEKQAASFKENMTALGEKKELSTGDKEALTQAETLVGKGLDELRLTTPSYWSYFMETVSLSFPGLAVDEAHVGDMDVSRARGLYKSFSDKISEAELNAIGKDIEELEEIKKFTAKLETGKPLSAADQALLTKYTGELGQINLNIQQSLVRAKTLKHQEIMDDASRTGFMEFLSDGTDALKIYAVGYGGIGYGIYWGVQKAVGENESLTNRAIGVSLTVGLLPVVANTVYAGYLIRTGEVAGGVGRLLCPPYVYLDVRNLYYSFLKDPALLLEMVIKGKVKPDWAQHMCNIVLKNEKLIPKTWRVAGPWLEHRMDHFKALGILFKNRVRLEWLENILTGKTVFDRAAKLEAWQEDLISLVEKRTYMTFDKFIEKMVKERGDGRIILEALDGTSFGIGKKMIAYFETAAKRFGDRPIPRAVLEKLFGEGGAGLEALKYFTKNASHLGLTAGMAYAATYLVCKDTYDAKDKSERIPLFVLSILVSDKVFTGVRAGEAFYGGARAGLTALQVGEGAISGTGLGEAAFAGFRAAELAPKHPLIMAIVAVLAAIGVSVGAEALIAPYLKSPGIIATATRGLGAPILYSLGAGQAIDTFGRYYNATNTTEKEYFMREIYLPKLGSKKMAFRDGDLRHPIDAYFNEMSPEDAVEVWNYQVREKQAALKKEDEALVAAGKGPAHSEEVKELDLKIIDKDWISRQIANVESKKIELVGRGADLHQSIMDHFGASMTPVEKRLVESILVTDVPETWFDESFYDIEKDGRFVLVRKYAKALGKDAELDTWVERKRQIYSDIEFYRTIKVDEKVMNPSQSEKMIALLGFDPKYAEKADALYDDVIGGFDFLGIGAESAPETESAAAPA